MREKNDNSDRYCFILACVIVHNIVLDANYILMNVHSSYSIYLCVKLNW
jgi:hypothetical protein